MGKAGIVGWSGRGVAVWCKVGVRERYWINARVGAAVGGVLSGVAVPTPQAASSRQELRKIVRTLSRIA